VHFSHTTISPLGETLGFWSASASLVTRVVVMPSVVSTISVLLSALTPMSSQAMVLLPMDGLLRSGIAGATGATSLEAPPITYLKIELAPVMVLKRVNTMLLPLTSERLSMKLAADGTVPLPEGEKL